MNSCIHCTVHLTNSFLSGNICRHKGFQAHQFRISATFSSTLICNGCESWSILHVVINKQEIFVWGVECQNSLTTHTPNVNPPDISINPFQTKFCFQLYITLHLKPWLLPASPFSFDCIECNYQKFKKVDVIFII